MLDSGPNRWKTSTCRRFRRWLSVEGGPLHDVSRSSGRTALGRSSLLPPQPDQPIAASDQRVVVSWCLWPDVRATGHRIAAWMAHRDALTPARTFLLRAEGLRRGEPGDARTQGSDQSRLQPAAKGRSALHLDRIAAAARHRPDALWP